ncbi:putative RNA-directed DNA polymerase from transposon BS [Trichonephila clavipes]|nr:putative RNA-directed DNA polymerase from transposon BS [Trichonephila clavipes]
MSSKSPFAIQKALVGIGGDPKSVKRLKSGDLLIKTLSAVQTKSFLLAKTFLNSSVTISPHKTLNSCRGFISEPDLLSTPEAEIFEGFSNQGVIQPKFTHNNKSQLPQLSPKTNSSTVISNLRSSCKILYFTNNSTQTDENITKIKCSPLKLLELLSSKPKPNASISTPNVSRLSSSAQAQLLLSTSSITTAYSESQPPIPTSNDAPSTNDMFTPIGTSFPIIPTSSSNSVFQPPSASNIQDTKKISKVRARKRKK